METNPFPEINLGIVDKARELGQRLVGLCSYFPPTGYHSDHDRGAAAMLDKLSPSVNEPSDGEAYEPSLNSYAEVADAFLEPAISEQQSFGFDSEGTYINTLGEAS